MFGKSPSSASVWRIMSSWLINYQSELWHWIGLKAVVILHSVISFSFHVILPAQQAPEGGAWTQVLDNEGGRKAGTLLGALDRCVTPGGRRLLRAWLLRPLLRVADIRARQDAVAALMGAASQAASHARSAFSGQPTGPSHHPLLVEVRFARTFPLNLDPQWCKVQFLLEVYNMQSDKSLIVNILNSKQKFAKVNSGFQSINSTKKMEH